MDKLNLIDFEKYTITKDGRIFSKHFNRYLTGHVDEAGYVRVLLTTNNNKHLSYFLHRVIWFYFNGEIPEKLEINHIDEDKQNNSIENLELLSRGDNVRYGSRTERAAITNSIVQKGRKLTKEHIEKMSLAHSKPILQYNIETNEPIREWKNSVDIQKILGYNSSFIGKCARGIIPKAHGYGWKYI